MTTRSIVKTAGKVGRVIALATVVIGYSSVTVSADTGTDPMRCEALKLKCDSRYHMCLSRCDSVADRRAARSVEDGEDMRSDCSAACELRHYNMQSRLDQRSVCKAPVPGPPPPPNPQACAAKVLWIKANYMQCMGRCHARFDRRPAFDCDGCMSQCYDVYREENDGTNADPVCGNGPAESISLEEAPSACTATN